jgi:hypothetical protein
MMEEITPKAEFVYLYGIIPFNEVEQKEVPLFDGINESHRFLIHYQDIMAVVCYVNQSEYSQEQIDLKIKNPKWLEQKAFHHHECISLIDKYSTILPFPFCTIFESENNVKLMLAEHYHILSQKLNTLHQKREWNLKIYYDSERLKSCVSENNPTVLAFQREIERMPKGKQFIMRKKLQQLIQEEVEKEQDKQIRELTEDLISFSTDYLIRKNWGKEITQRNDDMLLNGDFLVDKNNSEAFFTCIRNYERSFSNHGWFFQLTGPWPPYHFSKFVRET